MIRSCLTYESVLSPEISSLYLAIKARAPDAVIMGAVSSDWIRPFLMENFQLSFEFDYLSSKSASSVVPAKKALLMKIQIGDHHAFLLFDPHGKSIRMVHSGNRANLYSI